MCPWQAQRSEEQLDDATGVIGRLFVADSPAVLRVVSELCSFGIFGSECFVLLNHG